MSKIEAPVRIREEDYEAKDRSLVSKISGPINDFFDDVYNLLNGNVDFDNLSQRIVEIEVRRDATVNPTLVVKPQVKTGLNRKIQGVVCIDATNQDSPSTIPTSQPFVKFKIINSSTISIENVSGLQASSIYTLKLLLIT